MATSYTTFLGLALPVTGELSGTWGDTVNNYISNYLDAAIAGAQTVTTDTTLTKTTGSSLGATSSQYAIIIASPASANITITAPAASKIYTIINTSGTYTVKIVGAGPTTGVTLGVSEKAQVAWNGSDFIKISNTGGAASFTNVTITGTTTLSGLTASTALALDASKNVVSVTNTGTGNNVLSASPTLTGTIAGASLSLSSLTSGRVTYAVASGLLQDSANLTFNGTTLTANTLNLTNALGTTYGGTGLTSFTANGVVYASSSSALTTGSALTYDGTGLVVGSVSTFRGLGLYTSTASARPTINLVNLNTANKASYIQDSSTGELIFGQMNYDLGGQVEGMRLTSTGLGIGTSSPSFKFQTKVATNGNLAVTTPNSGTGARVWVVNDAVSAVQRLELQGNPVVLPLTSGADGLYFDATSGNLGLGVTPSAWFSTYKALQIGAYTALAQSGGSNTFLLNNAYVNAAGTTTYLNTAAASYYNQSAGAHSWYNAPSGTAGNAITFTQAMTLDASGYLGVGDTSPSSNGRISSIVPSVGSYNAQTAAWYGSNGTGSMRLWIANLAYSGVGANEPWLHSYQNMNIGSDGAINIKFIVGAEVARIDTSGNLLVGQTTSGPLNVNGVGIAPAATGGVDFNHVTGTASGVLYARFNYAGSAIGSITQSGTTAVLYNVTSDQRLKENIVDAPEFGSVIDSLQVRSFDWKTDQTHQRAGFVAQELVSVAPEAVHQPADPDEMMAVDYSKLVPMLVKEIQSLRIRIAQLEAK